MQLHAKHKRNRTNMYRDTTSDFFRKSDEYVINGMDYYMGCVKQRVLKVYIVEVLVDTTPFPACAVTRIVHNPVNIKSLIKRYNITRRVKWP